MVVNSVSPFSLYIYDHLVQQYPSHREQIQRDYTITTNINNNSISITQYNYNQTV